MTPRAPTATGIAAACLWLALLALAVSGAARADPQVGLQAQLTTDWRYRGVSLSDSRPVLSVTLSYDHPSGLYVAAAGIGGSTAGNGLQALGYQLYSGYAHRTAGDVSVDVGFTHTRLTEFGWWKERIEYSEVYAGVSWNDFSAYAYYAPHYLGDEVGTVYLDATKTVRLDDRWRLFGHLGVLTPTDPKPWSSIRTAQYDIRAGAAVQVAPWEMQLAYTRFGPGSGYPPNQRQRQRHDAVVFAVSYAF